jgi:hypothetical protein
MKIASKSFNESVQSLTGESPLTEQWFANAKAESDRVRKESAEAFEKKQAEQQQAKSKLIEEARAKEAKFRLEKEDLNLLTKNVRHMYRW